MNTTHTRGKARRVGLRAAAALALTVSLAACGTEGLTLREEFITGTALPVTVGTAAVGDPDACTHVDAPMLDIPTASNSEPQMRIPQPPGWERTNELDNLDEVIRFALVTTDLGATEPPQNVVMVTLEPAPETDAQAIFDDTRADLAEMLDEMDLPTDVTTTPGTVCGLPAETVTYAGTAVGLGAMTAPQGYPVTVLFVVTKTGGHTYLAAMVQTIEADNPPYRRDAETILTGFQVLPPAPANS